MLRRTRLQSKTMLSKAPFYFDPNDQIIYHTILMLQESSSLHLNHTNQIKCEPPQNPGASITDHADFTTTTITTESPQGKLCPQVGRRALARPIVIRNSSYLSDDVSYSIFTHRIQ